MRISRLSIAVCLAMPLVGQPVYAQTGSGVGSSEDIVVTARRTAERLQDVPIAVTAITGEAIEKRNMRTLADIQATTPSLNLTTQNAQGSRAAIGLRGQRQFNSSISFDPSVGVYLNDMYMGRTSIDTSLYDLESIQVLKGPQGTLFGRNSTGGAVLVSTRKAGDHFGGYVRAQFEDPWAYVAEAAVNVPLAEGAGFRVAGTRQYRRGYTNIVNMPGARADGRDRYGVRGTLTLEIGAVSMTTVGDYFRWDDSGTANFPLVRVSSVNGNASTAPIYAAYDQALEEMRAGNYLGRRVTELNARPFSKGRNYSGVNIATYDLTDNIRIKNIIGFGATRDENLVDVDSTRVALLSSLTRSSQHQFSEEFQIQGKSFGDALDWIVGAYYFRETGYDWSMGATLIDPDVNMARSNNHFSAENSAKSAFLHGSYLLPTGVTAHIFGGVRVGRDRREVTFKTGSVSATGAFSCSVAGAPMNLGVPGGECAFTRSMSFNSTTWDVGLDVKPVDDLMLYGSVSRGFRTGGFNGRGASAAQQLPFNPEQVTNYEAGLKFSGYLGNMHAMLNMAAFHSKYTDVQQNSNFVAENGGLTTIIINAAKARVNGFEAELSLRPFDGLTLSGYYGLTDAKFLSFEQPVAGGGTQDLSMNKFAGVPRNTAGGAIIWDAAASPGLGDLQVNMNVRYSDGFELQPINLAGARTRPYALVNAALRLDRAFGSDFSVELYVKNLFDKTYMTGGFSTAALGFANRTLGDPRVIGIGFRLPFGSE